VRLENREEDDDQEERDEEGGVVSVWFKERGTMYSGVLYYPPTANTNIESATHVSNSSTGSDVMYFLRLSSRTMPLHRELARLA
jgi:hypothetical protein